ncbi:MAG TPA: helix-turn-helix domain-containing protein [Tabrizicola sp.]|nr:helix-turn-helix domain-containing protein [Tabrizicola sp.]
MQDVQRRSQKERSDAMRSALVKAARDLFVRDGFAATATPDIVARAGVTRGALYHHFDDKHDLFAAVVRAEAEAVAAEIEATEDPGLDPTTALLRGGDTFLSAMSAEGRTRLLLIEAPAVLSPAQLTEIDSATGGRTLEEGLRAAGVEPVRPLAALLSAAFDRAALAIDQGEPKELWQDALQRIVRGITG